MFCIKCGKKAEIGNFCQSCYLKEHDLLKISNFQIEVCECGKFKDESWQAFEKEEELVKQAIRKRVDEKIKLDIKLKKRGNIYEALIHARGKIPPSEKEKEEEKKIEVKLRKIKCPRCVKISGGYYEALMQLRGKNAKKALEAIKKREDDFFSAEKDNGFDLKFLSKKDAKRSAKHLKDLNFKIKETYKLVGTKKGENLYRTTYSVR